MGNKILLITPFRFYGYSNNLRIAFENSGYEVSMMNDEFPVNDFGALLGYLNLELSRTLSRRAMRRKLMNDDVQYDMTFIIKGRGISVGLLEDLRRYSKRIVAYNFDSFGYFPHPLKWLKEVDEYHSFDFKDCEKYGLRRLDLYSSFNDVELKNERKYAISAVVRNHTERVKFIDEILKKIDGSIFVHIYEKSIVTLVLNFFTNPISMWRLRRHISLNPLPYEKYQEVIAGSVATIDYAHPKQTGLTIRCWEALSCGTKIVSNNKRLVAHEDFPNDSFLIWDSGTSEKELKDFLESPTVQKQRTAKDFIFDLMLDKL